jgi:hypothetical protein
MQNLFKNLIILITLGLICVSNINAQNYNEECKEDLRAFIRQQTYYNRLGININDTLS